MVEAILRAESCGHWMDVPDHFCHRDAAHNHLLIWVVAGRGFARTEGNDVEAPAGTLLSFLRGPAHTYGSDRQDPWDIFWVHFDGDAAVPLMQRIGRHGFPAAPLGPDPRLRERWLEFNAAFRSEHLADRQLAHHLLWGLLGLILHRLELQQGGDVPDRHEQLRAVQSYVHQHLGEPITAADLAGAAHLSTRQLNRLMHQTTGTAPMQYVLDQRMAHAAALLRQTSRPVKQVAAAAGYDDPYYFSRLFSRRMGRSPSSYRRGDVRE